jgi:hypothetical protein
MSDDAQVPVPAPPDATPPPEKKGMSKGGKCCLGCGCGCLSIIVAIALVPLVGYKLMMNKADQYAAEFKAVGIEEVVQKVVIEVAEPAADATTYMGAMVSINADCPSDLAIVAPFAQITGKIDGKVYFRGQILMVMPGAELRGGLDIKARYLQNMGQIEGEIVGEYQTLEVPVEE